ncbi:hypothetical protein BDY21DRAFT_352562 [Lineolata rhizophorae]|uniref:Uncharacterized protein n=1 Tax=Lineolata rhizophorae TaxID=578093 RepID=A0A6A6NTG3_9PEZI|nr:hypothetical protein BDY21DRAFT_352562 [Lineolata rhizophorae]
MSSAPEQNGAPSTEPLEASLSTLAIHADDEINTYNDVAPALHVSTTFRYASNPDELEPVDIPVCCSFPLSVVFFLFFSPPPGVMEDYSSRKPMQEDARQELN